MNHQRPNGSSLLLRARQRAPQRGAAVFVVMLVITLLTALGIFAVRSASLSTMASGFNRQLTQTHYVADYAVLSMVGELGLNAQVHSTNMTNGTNDQCVGYTQSLAALGTPSCSQYGYRDLDQVAQKDNNQNELLEPPTGVYPTNVVPGSLGAAPLEGDMRLEIRIGINTGVVIVGNMGSARRLSYTALGGVVNIAQRLESNAPVGGILISARTYDLLRGAVRTAEGSGITVEADLRTGDPFAIVSEVAQDCSLLIVGSQQTHTEFLESRAYAHMKRTSGVHLLAL